MRAWASAGLAVLAACSTPAASDDAARDARSLLDAVDARASLDVGADTGIDAAPAPVHTFVFVGLMSGELVTLDGDTLVELSRTATGDFPSFVAASADGAHLYIVHESANEVASADVASDGTTTVTGRQPALGGPAHVAIDHAGRHVFVASYGSGHTYVFGIDASGALSAPHLTDDVTCAHNAHQAVPNASDTRLYVPCLGDDAIVVRRIGASGSLSADTAAHTAAGAGPRHLAFSHDERFAYVLDELGSTLDVFSVDATSGALTSLETTTTLPAGFTGTNACAEVLVSADDRFVYASNRGDDSIAVFSRAPTTGRVALVEHEPAGGMHPRSMTLTRDGAHLYVADRDSDLIQVLDVASDGTLSPARTVAVAGRPYFIGEFLAP